MATDGGNTHISHISIITMQCIPSLSVYQNILGEKGIRRVLRNNMKLKLSMVPADRVI